LSTRETNHAAFDQPERPSLNSNVLVSFIFYFFLEEYRRN